MIMPDFLTSFDREQEGKHVANYEGLRGIGNGTRHNNMFFGTTLFILSYFNTIHIAFVFWGQNQQTEKLPHTPHNSTDLEKTPFLA